ncbi:alanine racemase [Acidisphaera sp. L21]|uniref:alanine racemase n=1 Tax=Acidisphaera sp. L21 TaxID=1641851 RepID=UPI00131BEF2E|nr:alanine racemase [Acidisphaera sp. L21]
MTASPAADSLWPTCLEIDTAAVVANWQSVRRGPTASVVKADAYGLGATKIAPALHAAGCRHFFTAHPSEAMAIRDLIPGAMLAVLNGLWPGLETDFAANDLTPVLGTLDEVDRWAAHARQNGRALPAILHIDTGMNRLGLDASELEVLAADPARLGGLTMRYVMTHLVSSECPADAINETQRIRFAAACARLPAMPRSLANSSGLFLGADFDSELSRPGAALYGVNPTPGQPNPQRSVVRLRARVLHVRDVPQGESVGYNGQWTAVRPSRIATVSVGYADGYLRSLSHRATAYFDDQPVPLVGRVSMDLSTFDVTEVPGLAAGHWLDMIGPGGVDALAAEAGTNGYEILTSLGRRYKRVYL